MLLVASYLLVFSNCVLSGVSLTVTIPLSYASKNEKQLFWCYSLISMHVIIDIRTNSLRAAI